MKCPICKSRDIHFIMVNAYRCKFCNHIFRNNNFNYSFYEENNYWFTNKNLKLLQKMFFAFFEDFITINEKTTSIEFGAATGDFLYWIDKKKHHKIYYNDLADVMRKEYKFKKLICPGEQAIARLEVDNAKIDNVFMIDVIEHLKDPFMFNSKIFKTGTRFFIATDSADSINCNNLLLYHPEHLNLFSKDSMEIFAEKIKCDVVFYWNCEILDMVFVVLEKW